MNSIWEHFLFSLLILIFCERFAKRQRLSMWQINFYHLCDPVSGQWHRSLVSWYHLTTGSVYPELGSLSQKIISLPKPLSWLPTWRQKGVGWGPNLDDDNFAGLVIFSPSWEQTLDRGKKWVWRMTGQDLTSADIETGDPAMPWSAQHIMFIL